MLLEQSLQAPPKPWFPYFRGPHAGLRIIVLTVLGNMVYVTGCLLDAYVIRPEKYPYTIPELLDNPVDPMNPDLTLWQGLKKLGTETWEEFVDLLDFTTDFKGLPLQSKEIMMRSKGLSQEKADE